jgi:hypothetical protein
LSDRRTNLTTIPSRNFSQSFGGDRSTRHGHASSDTARVNPQASLYDLQPVGATANRTLNCNQSAAKTRCQS